MSTRFLIFPLVLDELQLLTIQQVRLSLLSVNYDYVSSSIVSDHTVGYHVGQSIIDLSTVRFNSGIRQCKTNSYTLNMALLKLELARSLTNHPALHNYSEVVEIIDRNIKILSQLLEEAFACYEREDFG